MSIFDNSNVSYGGWQRTNQGEQLWNIYNATAGFNIPTFTQVQFSNWNNSATPPQPGNITLSNEGNVVATIAISFDGDNNISEIIRTS